METMALVDTLGRPLRSIRVSVTDRCNLRCEYCMPEEEYVWLSRDDLLHFEEISRLVDVFIGLGVDKVRLTGGEPLLRSNLCQLVELLAEKPARRSRAHHERDPARRVCGTAEARRLATPQHQPRHAEP